jgi:DNA-binding NarL/FixJ family response regulator
MSIRLVLADDHPIVLDGLENLFRGEPDFKVLARCLGIEDTLEVVRHHRPDVLILDLQMPGKGNLDVLRHMKAEKLPTRVVLLTATLDEDVLLEAIRLGISGVVLKEMAPEMIVRCVRKVYAGEQWLESRSYMRALETLLQREAGTREVAQILTPREIEIVRMVASNMRNKDIAKKLFISEGTVKTHLHHIFEKFQVDSREKLIIFAQEKGLLTSLAIAQRSNPRRASRKKA